MISKTQASNLLNYVFGRTGLTRYNYIYMGLCAEQPNHDDGTVNGEPATTVGSDKTGYARIPVGGQSAGVNYFANQATGGVIENSEEIQLNTIRKEGGLGNMKYWFLSESSSSTGKAILWGGINWNEGSETFDGLDLNYETVPVFYAGDLKASIDVDLT